MKRLVMLALIATILSGCSSAAGPILSESVASASQPAVHPFDAALRKKDLLYASSIFHCTVFLYTYPHAKLVESFDACAFGYGPAFGLCSDKNGDVFMAMGQGFSTLKFAHGGTQPIAQLDNGSHQPFGCAVDPKSGNLAIAAGEGNVSLFKNTSDTPQIYNLSGIYAFYFCTFDDRGNLWLSGQHYDNTFALAELPKGGNALREIAVSGIAAGFAIQWDGRRVAVGVTQEPSDFVIGRLRIHGSTAKIVGTTTLHGAPNTLVPFQFWIDGSTVIRPENANMELGYWNYPAGGDQTKEIRPDGKSLIGVTVSSAARR